jgi:DNA-binding transcriptional ArsR family regulator
VARPQNKRRTPASTKAEGSCGVFAFDEDRVRRVRKAMLPEATIADVADTFKVLSSPTRVRVIRALAQEELCVCDLSKVLGLSVSATSHQLQAMRNARIVRYRMDGKLAYYSLRNSFILALLEDGVRHVSSDGGAD